MKMRKKIVAPTLFESNQSVGFRVHPNGEIELLSERETSDIIARTINAAVARGLGGRRTVH
jgi:hypothetical protein